MKPKPQPTNRQTVTVEVNGQQEQLIRRLVAADPGGRSAEEIIRAGFLEFAKRKRLSAE